MAKTLATQRSLQKLRSEGWTACIVEKFLPARGKMKFPRRIDAFGIGDILACRRDAVRGFGSIALVQTFPLARWKDHTEKILKLPELERWREAGGIVIFHGWALRPKGGVRGAKKIWQVRQEEL